MRASSIEIRDADSNDIDSLANIFVGVFFEKKFFRKVILYFIKRDIKKRIMSGGSKTYVCYMNGDLVSAFRAKKFQSAWLVDSFLIDIKNKNVKSFTRVRILNTWASFLFDNLKSEHQVLKLIFSSDNKKHIDGYASVISRNGYVVETSRLEKNGLNYVLEYRL